MSEKLTVYTLGHSNRSLSEFIALLRRYSIRVIVDVRRFPTSRACPWFSKDSLSKALSAEGIEYVWLGELLGGYRSGGYEKYMSTDAYAHGISVLVDIIRRHNGHVAIMCSEKLWFRCHRRFIADTLTSLGIEVIHIIDVAKLYKHKGPRKLNSQLKLS